MLSQHFLSFYSFLLKCGVRRCMVNKNICCLLLLYRKYAFEIDLVHLTLRDTNIIFLTPSHFTLLSYKIILLLLLLLLSYTSLSSLLL